MIDHMEHWPPALRCKPPGFRSNHSRIKHLPDDALSKRETRELFVWLELQDRTLGGRFSKLAPVVVSQKIDAGPPLGLEDRSEQDRRAGC
jgi:hypothetical protein